MPFLVILTVLLAFGPTLSEACSDGGCPLPLTAVLSDMSALERTCGLGTAVLSPYNDSRVNLLLAMTRPAGDQTVENIDLPYRDAASGIKSPFYIEAIQRSGDPEEKKRAEYNHFVELLRALGLNDDELKRSLDRINRNYRVPDLSPLAYRALDFHKIVRSDGALDETDRRQIIRYLLELGPAATTANTEDYCKYISAANAFHANDWDKAKQLFALLLDSRTAWVREASLYNLIRIEIHKTHMQSTDRYGLHDVEDIDQVQAAKILPAIQRYLSEFPNGLYADSARNLKRRAYWLTRDNKNLIRSFSDAIRTIRERNDFLAAAMLAMEIDDKYPRSAPSQIEWDDPVIATSQILIRLRKPASAHKADQYDPVELAAIIAHEDNFKRQNALSLYQYLLTAYDFFKEERYEAVVQGTENWKENLAQADHAGFSRAALRAEALGKLKRWQDASTLLKELRELSPSPLLKDNFQLAQAQNLEASGNLARVFEPDSIIQSPVLRERLLRSSANDRLLEYVLDQQHTAAREKAVALVALLYKELLSRRYKTLLEHQKKYGALKLDDVDGLGLLRNETVDSADDFVCPKWSEVLGDLSGPRASPRALLCLGERLRTLEDSYMMSVDRYRNELGSSDDGFNTSGLTRLSLYLAVIDDPSAGDDDKSFALRRALYCFATTGYNHCGPGDVPLEQRKAWFTKLKSRYKNSPWAMKQKYYW
jgi:hypothetical protein